MDLQRANPPEDYRDLGVGQGRQRGERTSTGNGVWLRHATRGTGTSNRGWQVEGAGDVQVGSALHWERMWGAGEKREDFDDERLRMGRR